MILHSFHSVYPVCSLARLNPWSSRGASPQRLFFSLCWASRLGNNGIRFLWWISECAGNSCQIKNKSRRPLPGRRGYSNYLFPAIPAPTRSFLQSPVHRTFPFGSITKVHPKVVDDIWNLCSDCSKLLPYLRSVRRWSAHILIGTLESMIVPTTWTIPIRPSFFYPWI